MTVAQLIEQLSQMDPNSRIIVKQGKYAFVEASDASPGFYHRTPQDWQPDEEGEGGTDSVLIS